MRPRVQVLVPADSNQHNEHQNSHHNRYSYLHTPAELHAPTFPQQNHSQRSLSVPVNAAEPPVPPPLEHRAYTHPQPQPQPHTHTHTRTRTRTEAQPNPRPFSYMPSVMHHEPRSEKASLHAHTQSAPPLSEHPAHSAPYADSVENTTNNAQSQARVSQLPQQSADHTLQLSPSRDQFHQPQNSVTLSPTHSQFPQHLQQPSAALSPTYSHSAQQPPSAALSSTRDQFPQKPPTAAQEQARREKELAIVPDSNPLEPLGSPVPQTPRSPAPAYNRTMALPDHNGLNHLPGQVMHPNQRLTGDTWNYGLGDCSDISTCCLGIFCPCILYGRTQYRLNQKSERKDPTNLLGHETCNASCTAMALLCGCQWLLATIQHSRTRRQYAIPGSIPSDCVRATCCTCCTLIQDEREIKIREEGARQTVSTPYLPPGHMTFSPPPR